MSGETALNLPRVAFVFRVCCALDGIRPPSWWSFPRAPSLPSSSLSFFPWLPPPPTVSFASLPPSVPQRPQQGGDLESQLGHMGRVCSLSRGPGRQALEVETHGGNTGLAVSCPDHAWGRDFTRRWGPLFYESEVFGVFGHWWKRLCSEPPICFQAFHQPH